MKRIFASILVGACASWAAASPAFAQAASQQTPPPPASGETRPATTTFLGDTGLWFVPTGEILPPKGQSFSVYYYNFDRTEGFTDVGNFLGTYGYGVGRRAEIFASVRFITRIDRDFRPLYDYANSAGGPVNEHPLVSDQWSGNQFGDIFLGGKFNLLSEYDQKPVALAVRAIVKLPTGDEESGASTGKADFALDAIVSKEVNQRVELSGYAGFITRGSPDDVGISNGFRYGFGAGFPTRSSLKITAEIFGEKYFDDQLSTEIPPSILLTDNRSPVEFALGATWISPKGIFAGAGFTYGLNGKGRDDFGSQFGSEGGDYFSGQFRIGYHPGVRVYAPPPPPPPPPAPPAAPVNRPPTVKARCEPCIVEVGKSATVTGDANDPDGDPLTYRWNTPTGTLANPADRQTLWTAPMQEGSVPVTVCVDDGKSGKACDTVTIQVVKPPVKEYKFEDVHFDFDRYSLRPEAARILDEAIRAMQENANLRLEIEGHTCSIGTAEYNLALGERRANSVRDYLTSRGITADRLRTVSYGEERPKHDNAREETRRLNRRAEMVVRLQQ
jgi:outer membrane protein OmpA-like peptidoglycan-associated protein